MRPTVPEVLPLLNAIYARHCAGCCLHIVVDDYNVEDSSVQFCLEHAIEKGHEECIIAALQLLQMTRTQRLRAAHRHE